MNKTILIKLSGESLSGKNGHGLDFDYIKEVCLRIKRIHDKGVYIGIVCGGGNFLRGRDTHAMNRETADYVGMLATVMNSLVLKDMFLQLGCKAYNQSGLSVKIIDDVDSDIVIYTIDKKIFSDAIENLITIFVDSDKAKRALLDGNIVIFGGGTGKPFFSTDTGAALRAKDIGADIIIKLTNVDGVYDKDPNKYSDAVMYHTVSYKEVIDKKLGVMDMEAIEICRDNNIKIVVTNIDNVNALDDIIEDKNIGTVVYK